MVKKPFLILVGLILTSVQIAEAQQQRRYLRLGSSEPVPAPASPGSEVIPARVR